MNGQYKTHIGEIYQIRFEAGSKQKAPQWLCKRIKALAPGAVLDQEYPIDENHIKRMVLLGLWVKM